MEGFEEKVAIVTGASGALGGALARRLLGLGAIVETFDRSPESAAGALADLAAGDRLAVRGVDLTDAEAVERAVGEVVERRGRVDHLFATVGGFAFDGPVESSSLATWERMLDVNLRTALHAVRAVLPAMKARGSGTIVLVGSEASLAGGAKVAAYSASKAALLRLAESLAAECRGSGVRINCVLPGTLDTAANRDAMPDADRSGWVDLDAVVDAMLFLASPAARAVHGAALAVTGAG